MPLVRLDFDYGGFDLFKQTPAGSARWGDYYFTDEAVKNPDILVVMNYPSRDIDIEIKKGGTCLLSQEPPIDLYRWTARYFNCFDHVFTQWDKKSNPGVILSHGMLPWHVDKTYDQLALLGWRDLKKDNKVSWITSNLRNTSGHRRRLKFLESVQAKKFGFDLFGRGFKPIADKYDGLAPYKYSFALENYSCDDYWTEKIADCYLSWTMPIYWGCKNIEKYFPPESMILIDPNNPVEAIEIVRSAMESDAWGKNLEAISEARNRVLNKFQLFPAIVDYFGGIDLDKSQLLKLYVPRAEVPRQSWINKISSRVIKMI